MKKIMSLVVLVLVSASAQANSIEIHCGKGRWHENNAPIYFITRSAFLFETKTKGGFNGPVTENWRMNDYTHSIDWQVPQKGEATAATFRNKSGKWVIEIKRDMGNYKYTFRITKFHKETQTAILRYYNNYERQATEYRCNVTGGRELY